MSAKTPGPSEGSRSGKKRKKLSLSTVLIVLAVMAAAVCGGVFAARYDARPRVTPAPIATAAPAASPTPAASPSSTAEAPRTASQSGGDDTEEEWGARVRWQGETYVRRDKLQTLLFMGVDNVQYEQQALGSAGRTDTLILFVLNTEDQTAKMITISRDTMVDVDVYDDTGRKLFTGEMQITMQYGYGDSPKRCALLTERRVAELLHGIRIDGYLALTMDGIAPIVDGLGGIRLTLDQDFSDVNASYTRGAVVALDGAAVQRLVRYRNTSILGSNSERMARDAWLIKALFSQMRGGGVSVSQILDLAEDYMNTDLSAETLRNFARYTMEDEILTLPGQSRAGDSDEFYVDDEGVKALLIDVFYEKG